MGNVTLFDLFERYQIVKKFLVSLTIVSGMLMLFGSKIQPANAQQSFGSGICYAFTGNDWGDSNCKPTCPGTCASWRDYICTGTCKT